MHSLIMYGPPFAISGLWRVSYQALSSIAGLKPSRMVGARIVTFADGREAQELLVDLDDARRRLVYAEPGGRFITRSASVQVFAEGERATRVVWIIDVLPNEFASLMAGKMDKATAIMKRTLEASAQG
jgi:hypothetical protein